jgi:hypothetical protein
MEPLRMQPLMPESEMQSPSLKSSPKLTSVQQFLSNYPMRSIIAEKENHYPAKTSPPASGVPTAPLGYASLNLNGQFWFQYWAFLMSELFQYLLSY